MSGDNELRLLSAPRLPPIVNGRGNLVHLGRGCDMRAQIDIAGDDNVVFLDDNVAYHQGWLGIRASGATIRIGRNTTIGGATISAHEAACITFGEDCMLSVDVFMDVSDMHPIADGVTGERINPAADIMLGNHVWIGLRVILMKGVQIGSGAVIGAGSVVTSAIPPRCVAAGNPARVVREGIAWRRDF